MEESTSTLEERAKVSTIEEYGHRTHGVQMGSEKSVLLSFT